MGLKSPVVIAKTPNWIVINKPPGWLTIPGRSNSGDSVPVLSEWLEQDGAPIWVVHRIDRETSGVVLFARHAEAHRQASLWFQRHEVKKTYHFLAQGQPSAPILRINSPVGGLPSVTQIEVKFRAAEGFLGIALPQSGRRHQIRIHLASKGWPLWGDSQYGGRTEITFAKDPMTVDRVALHAAKLELPGGEKFEAPSPEDFSGWERCLREKGSRG